MADFNETPREFLVNEITFGTDELSNDRFEALNGALAALSEVRLRIGMAKDEKELRNALRFIAELEVECEMQLELFMVETRH